MLSSLKKMFQGTSKFQKCMENIFSLEEYSVNQNLDYLNKKSASELI